MEESRDRGDPLGWFYQTPSHHLHMLTGRHHLVRSNVHADEAKQPKGGLTQEDGQLCIFIPKIQLRFLSISELVYVTIIISSLFDSPRDQILQVIM